jgi:uncharacterized protein
MPDILKEIKEKLPKTADITSCNFEAANIIVYTKNKQFFLDNKGKVRELVNEFKKRIEVRPDPKITMVEEKAEKLIREILPKDSKVDQIIFDPQRSQVIIEVEKPGIAIGKAGENLNQIKDKTTWVPLIKRTPAIRSKMIENIRAVLYENNDFRRKFLNDVGKRIYNGWIRGKKNEWVRVSFLGAGRQVGRSSIFLQTPESRVLLDCGINVAAPEKDMYPQFDIPEFKIQELDAVVVSHAHLDHSSMVPLLIRYGYKGPVYCTYPTRDIMALLALDYISVGYKEMKNPPFTIADVKQMVKQTICLDFNEVSDISPDIRITLYDSGHILGSAMVHLHIGNGLHNLLYTADMLYDYSNLLSRAVTKFPRLETVIIEATYGGKDNTAPTRKECEEQLFTIVKETVERGGKALFPVLGVGRSQEIMIIVERAIREGKMPKVPVYIQGMVWDVTAIHTAYPDFFNSKIKKEIFYEGKNPFLSEIFTRVAGYKEMQKVIESEEPCIIITTSGMLTGGAAVEYFKHLAPNPKNSITLTCYQARGSLGNRLQLGEREISYSVSANKSEVIQVKCGIHTINGFSGHSSRTQLMNFLKTLNPKPRRVITNHGESGRCLDLASSTHKLLRIETSVPRNMDSLRLV